MICAEIPEKEKDPETYEAVKKFMMHGSCGETNPMAPCMVNHRCIYQFPKSLCDETIIGEDGYPIYRRRDEGQE